MGWNGGVERRAAGGGALKGQGLRGNTARAGWHVDTACGTGLGTVPYLETLSHSGVPVGRPRRLGAQGLHVALCALLEGMQACGRRSTPSKQQS